MNGATDLSFRKVDLHVHTPESICYSDRSVTPGQIVEAALAANLEAIAITDHNTAEAINDIRQAARDKALTVFPGIELSTKSGHVIAIFDLDTPLKKLQDFLDYVGIKREGWGDAAMVAIDEMEDILRKTAEWGGIAIAAHIDRWPSGLLETNEPRRVKMRIHGNEYLSALEITVPQNKDMWNAGQMRNYPKRYACIQGSDAHVLSEIGRRPIYIQMERIDLKALRSAFTKHDAKIVFADEFPPN